jgi:hypothetical protein
MPHAAVYPCSHPLVRLRWWRIRAHVWPSETGGKTIVETPQRVQPGATPEERRHHGGRPWPKGVSGNPSGSKLSKRFAELFAAVRAEFGDAALSASDRALLEQACRLMARRMRDEENSIKATNAARRIIASLHARHGRTPASPSPVWSPLRSRLQAAASAPVPAPKTEGRGG